MQPGSRMPPLKALRAFEAAGRHLSFKRAAEELCVTASAVSHQVKNLESFLGFDLFVRRTRALSLTDAGSSYHAFLADVFARLEAETHQVCAAYGRGIIRLSVPPFFAQELLMPQLEALQSVMPDTDIRLVMQPSLMQSHPAEADLSILLGPGDWPELDAVPLFRADTDGLFARIQKSQRHPSLPRPGRADTDRAREPAELVDQLGAGREHRATSGGQGAAFRLDGRGGAGRGAGPGRGHRVLAAERALVRAGRPGAGPG